MANSEDFAAILHNIASREPAYQEFTIISSLKLHAAANSILTLTELIRGLAYDVLEEPTTSEDLKQKAREALGSI